MNAKRAKVFWSGRSQAIRLPKEFRFEGEAVLVRRLGNGVVLEPADEWPVGYLDSFKGSPGSFRRAAQGPPDSRERLE